MGREIRMVPVDKNRPEFQTLLEQIGDEIIDGIALLLSLLAILLAMIGGALMLVVLWGMGP